MKSLEGEAKIIRTGRDITQDELRILRLEIAFLEKSITEPPQNRWSSWFLASQRGIETNRTQTSVRRRRGLCRIRSSAILLTALAASVITGSLAARPPRKASRGSTLDRETNHHRAQLVDQGSRRRTNKRVEIQPLEPVFSFRPHHDSGEGSIADVAFVQSTSERKDLPRSTC